MAQRFLRLHEVQTRTGLARATIYLRISNGTFPSSVPLGSPHAVGWLDSEIDQWISAQVDAARDQPSRGNRRPTTAVSDDSDRDDCLLDRNQRVGR